VFGRWVIVLCAVAGCYRPDFSRCLVKCNANSGCPDGQACALDAYCHAPGDERDCREDAVACGQEVCAARGKDCGDVIDSCGETIDCGDCTQPETCGGGGTNVCGEGECTPRTCADAQALCGHPSNGCNGVLDCGPCTGPQSCGGGGTSFTCGCGPIASSADASHRMGHSQVFTGTTMIVWGGRIGNDYLRSGAIYNFATKAWTPLPVDANTPSHRAGHAAVWTGTEMIVWGGHIGNTYHGDGARFSPATGTWSTLSLTGAPGPRAYHTAVWTGARMLVWGGQLGQQEPKRDGAAFDPATGGWTALPVTTATPAERAGHSAVWTGTEMIVWGGIVGAINGLFECGGSSIFRDGGRYNPTTNAWTALPASASVPDYRTGHVAAWTGTRMLVWGGCNGSDYFNDGKSLDLATNTWTALPWTVAACLPAHRAYARAVWTGDDMLIWGGVLGSDYFNDGYRIGP
jgi:hypothetical protein